MYKNIIVTFPAFSAKKVFSMSKFNFYSTNEGIKYFNKSLLKLFFFYNQYYNIIFDNNNFY